MQKSGGTNQTRIRLKLKISGKVHTTQLLNWMHSTNGHKHLKFQMLLVKSAQSEDHVFLTNLRHPMDRSSMSTISLPFIWMVTVLKVRRQQSRLRKNLNSGVRIFITRTMTTTLQSWQRAQAIVQTKEVSSLDQRAPSPPSASTKTSRF